MKAQQDSFPWWDSLKHSGLLIAPSKLAEHFSEAPPSLSRHQEDVLRRAVTRALSGDTDAIPALLDVVLEQVLGLHPTLWRKGNAVTPEDWSRRLTAGSNLKPSRVWRDANGATLPVFVVSPKEAQKARLGIGQGRRDVSNVAEWMRRADQKIALVTNGRQWRLLHAGADYEAFCEWDINLWFEQGSPGPQVTALRTLLRHHALSVPGQAGASPLLAAILDSRKGQAELSAQLGERVRQAVEHLIQASAPRVAAFVGSDPQQKPARLRELYIAATRLVMRCVVILFAEARELLPREHAIYDGSYGLQALRELLDRLAGGHGERLRHGHSAWPRLMSLFRLVFQGSAHEALPIPSYGGKLFESGDPDARDGVLRALWALEQPANNPTDDTVHRILELLTRSKVKVRQGRQSSWVPTPINFSDLSSEYIGILYEGLLDFELKQASEPIVFLDIGAEPALPFSRLDALTAPQRKDLLEKLKKVDKSGGDDEEGEEEADGAEDEEVGEDVDSQEDESTEALDDEPEPEVQDTDRRTQAEAVQLWARNAVRDAGWCKRGADLYSDEVTKEAKQLVRRIVMTDEFYLIRWGGTRKGSGTFYTRPQLAGPTTRRALKPLAYEPIHSKTDPDTGLTDVLEWAPRTPEAILDIKLCDPAMGSGSFLISALRFLVDAFVESLYHHKRLQSNAQRTICQLASGLPLDHPSQETLPVPLDAPDFGERLRARLRRHVVERCLYGVDLDPLAVELGQMALWVETMDRSLPFGFLDHKLKVGNGLVGCWLDRFQDYPIMAWSREGGDKAYEKPDAAKRLHRHIRFHEKKGGATEQRGDVWTHAIKEKREELKTDLAAVVINQTNIFKASFDSVKIHEEARKTFDALHALPVYETQRRAELYTALLASPGYVSLKAAFDTWCALWFWPGDALDLAPIPSALLRPSPEAQHIVQQLAASHLFFHWELEFPDVFDPKRQGFDAIIGNPPWEIQKPNSKEFFSNLDPLYRTYGKQEALDHQQRYFQEDPHAERDWISYNAKLKGMSNWAKHAAAPFGDSDEPTKSFSFSRSTVENKSRHKQWKNHREKRILNAEGNPIHHSDPNHPFQHQGSADLNTYKMFLELAYALTRKGGYFGFIVPSGIYTDKGSTELRTLFLNRCQWEWLFGFENRDGIFNIHRSFKFCPILICKGGKTTSIRAAFMHRRLEDWESAEKHVLAYPRDRVEQFSPKSKAILEIRSERDLEVLTKLYSNGVLLGDDGPEGWGLKYATEFHMTNDSKLFPPLEKWENLNFTSNNLNVWENSKNEIALPVYNAKMFDLFDFSSKKYISGKGRSSVWEPVNFPKYIGPEYLMHKNIFDQKKSSNKFIKIIFKDISTSTHYRTMLSCVVINFPTINAAPILTTDQESHIPLLQAVLGSFCLDNIARFKIGYLHLNYFIIEEFSLVKLNCLKSIKEKINKFVFSLCCTSEIFAPLWLQFRGVKKWKQFWAATTHEKIRIRCILDAIVAVKYGIDREDFMWILKDCDHPNDKINDKFFCRNLDAKGFWRVDKKQNPELRHTVLTLLAFDDLQKYIALAEGDVDKGIQNFCDQHDGDGWMLPETLCIADLGLTRTVDVGDYDDRALIPQPVRSSLGERFYDWQLEQDVEESWEECARHAALIERIIPSEPVETPSVTPPEPAPPAPSAGPTPTDLFGVPLPRDLLGNVIYPQNRKK